MPIIVFFSKTPWRRQANPRGGAQVAGGATLLHTQRQHHLLTGPLWGSGSLLACLLATAALLSSRFCGSLNTVMSVPGKRLRVGKQADVSTGRISSLISPCPTPSLCVEKERLLVDKISFGSKIPGTTKGDTEEWISPMQYCHHHSVIYESLLC